MSVNSLTVPNNFDLYANSVTGILHGNADTATASKGFATGPITTPLNLQANLAIVKTGTNENLISIQDGNSNAYIFTNYAALTDGVGLSYNYYVPGGTNTPVIPNAGIGTTIMYLGYNMINFGIGASGVAPTTYLSITNNAITAKNGASFVGPIQLGSGALTGSLNSYSTTGRVNVVVSGGTGKLLQTAATTLVCVTQVGGVCTVEFPSVLNVISNTTLAAGTQLEMLGCIPSAYLTNFTSLQFPICIPCQVQINSTPTFQIGVFKIINSNGDVNIWATPSAATSGAGLAQWPANTASVGWQPFSVSFGIN